MSLMMQANQKSSFPAALESALHTIDLERRALDLLARQLTTTDLGTAFTSLVDLIVAAEGRVIITGMGKSGLVGRKLAATFASTGTPSFYIHPAEASHGDLGMITRNDIVIALSWSGETAELSDILNYCARFAVKLVAITSNRDSILAKQAERCLCLPKVQEACPNDLAPTSSTTVQAALGDALAVATIELRQFSKEDFRVFHPRGQLAAKLIKISDIMSAGDRLPRVSATATIAEATFEMSAKRFGITAVTGPNGDLIGAFSDGDLRRSLGSASVNDLVCNHMSRQPFVVGPDLLASEALALMNARNISQLFVKAGQDLVGIVHVHDILRSHVA